jgi:hypothetical protein
MTLSSLPFPPFLNSLCRVEGCRGLPQRRLEPLELRQRHLNSLRAELASLPAHPHREGHKGPPRRRRRRREDRDAERPVEVDEGRGALGGRGGEGVAVRHGGGGGGGRPLRGRGLRGRVWEAGTRACVSERVRACAPWSPPPRPPAQGSLTDLDLCCEGDDGGLGEVRLPCQREGELLGVKPVSCRAEEDELHRRRHRGVRVRCCRGRARLRVGCGVG